VPRASRHSPGQGTSLTITVSVADPDPHQIDKLDPDPHHSDKLDSDTRHLQMTSKNVPIEYEPILSTIQGF
jgi:hypothetical protein